MTSSQQRAALQRQIWAIANDVRGAVDGWDFKQYVLGTLFYRFISENFAIYIEGGDDSVNYAELPDSVITPDIKDDAIKTKGYFIYSSQLFATIAASANTKESLNTDLAAIFASIESSANGYLSRIINFTSHSTLSNEAVAVPTQAEKATVKLLLDHLKSNHGFWQQGEITGNANGSAL